MTSRAAAWPPPGHLLLRHQLTLNLFLLTMFKCRTHCIALVKLILNNILIANCFNP